MVGWFIGQVCWLVSLLVDFVTYEVLCFLIIDLLVSWFGVFMHRVKELVGFFLSWFQHSLIVLFFKVVCCLW